MWMSKANTKNSLCTQPKLSSNPQEWLKYGELHCVTISVATVISYILQVQIIINVREAGRKKL